MTCKQVAAVVVLSVAMGINVTATDCVAAARSNAHNSSSGGDVLWYAQPAGKWTEALALGNGRLGAMVFGTPQRERLQLNEESLWAGEPADPVVENAPQIWRQVRELILAEKISEARKLALEKLTISPTSYRSYQPVGDLWIELDHPESVTGYRRDLDLAAGVARVEYVVDKVRWMREVFISAVDDVMVVRLRTDKPGSIQAAVRLTRSKDARITAAGDNRLHMDGQIVDIAAPQARDDNPGGSGAGGEHMRFAGRLGVRTQGGRVRAGDDHLIVAGADEVILLFTATTDYNLDKMNYDRSIDPAHTADAILKKASKKSWAQLYSDHVSEHRAIFERVSIDLGGSKQQHAATDERLKAVKAGAEDPALTALYFQFGRYLLMSSSRRPGRLGANLQGIWNDRMWAPWEADYHLNINLQMNYWPADLCNLSETVDSLADWFEQLTRKGRLSAKRLYDADGWVAFTCTNPFGRTTPSGSNKSSQFQNGLCDPLAGAWMAMTLWRHYEFTQDERFLRERAYPILKGAAEFILDYLAADADGYLVTAPSTSPENAYIHPETGQGVRLTRGSTYHNQIIRAIFDAVVRSSSILGVDEAFAARLKESAAKLPPLKIGGDGTIQEWIEDYKEQSPGHRHMSHLMGLHPFDQITTDTPGLLAAAGRTIARRLQHGGGHTGWSRAWIINFQARLFDGERAREHVRLLLQKSTHPNLFDNHPPFQIDGNFGGTAGIAEMLLQSHAGRIHLLPALPKAWSNGHIHGLKARGGFEVDIDWKDGKLTTAAIHSHAGRSCTVLYDNKTVRLNIEKGKSHTIAPASFATPIGKGQ